MILTTLVFTKFGILKHLQFRLHLFLNVFEPPYLVLQFFDFTTLRRYLPRNSQWFTP